MTLSVVNGGVLDADILAAQASIQGFLANHYASISSSNKQIIAVDFKMESVDGNSALYKVVSFIGAAPFTPTTPPTNCDVYGPNDSWYSNWNTGKCDGSNSGKDAADALGEEINQRNPLPNNHLYFVNIEQAIINPIGQEPYDLTNPNDPNPGDGYRESLVYKSWTDVLSHPVCLPEFEMEWYYCNLRNLINGMVPQGKNFSHLEFFDEQLGSTVGHYGNVYFGTSVQCPCLPCPPTLPQEDCTQCC